MRAAKTLERAGYDTMADTDGMTPEQLAVDDAVASWPGVRRKRVFGARGFVRGRVMFAFLTGDRVAVKAPTPDDVAALYSRPEVTPFAYNEMVMRAWPLLPLRSDDDLEEALTAARRAYEAAG